jgi:hypothetical protein
LKRLIDEGRSPDSPEGRLATLIQAMPALERAPFARERVFARVVSAAATRRKRLPWTAGAIALGLGISAVAAASVGHLEFFVRPSPSSLTAPLTAPLPLLQAGTAIPEASRAIATPEPVALDKADGPPASPPSPSRLPKLHARSVESRPLVTGEDPAALLEAIRTLRSNHDPVRAGALLAEYLKAYPHSPLSEDALALSIEAAITRHDSTLGAELARRYLAQFPNGRYRPFASRAAQFNPQTDSP